MRFCNVDYLEKKNKMENLAQKVERALNDVNKHHIVALEHAASISPFVHNRSIGADKKSVELAEGTTTSQRKCDRHVKHASPENKSTISCPVLTHQEVNSLQNLDFSTINSSVLRRDAEENRKRSIRQHVVQMQSRHWEIMQVNLKPVEKHIQEKSSKWLESKQQNELLILQKAEQHSASDLKEHERQLESLRLETEKQLQLISFQGISQYQSKFRNKYEVIVSLLMSIDKAALMSCTEYNRKLKELIQMFEQLIVKIKGGECGPMEMKTAENLCKALADLEISIVGAVKQEKEKREQVVREQQRQEKEAESVAAADLARQESEKEALEPARKLIPDQETLSQPASHERIAVAEETVSSISNQFVSPERLDFYTKITSYYQGKVERVKVLQSDETMKKYRFDCQKSINIPVNAISAVNQHHIQDKFDKLFSFVNSQPAWGRDYCILLMAKKFVGQGETTISSNPQAAFPVASVIVSLWKCIPDFGQLFLAYCFKECPFLVPYFIPQKEGQTIEDYSKVLGYKMVDGQLEKQDMYLKRHAGIARLYAAVMITNGRMQDGPSSPYGLEHAWRWLANIVALAPLPDISATLLMEILQIVGSGLWSSYGRQFVKLLMYIQRDYFPKLSSVDEGGPKARLELLLSKFLREGQIHKPVGMLPPGFW